MHKIDTSAQHFLSNYYGGDSDSDSDGPFLDDENGQPLEDQTAYDIFKSKEADASGGRRRSSAAAVSSGGGSRNLSGSGHAGVWAALHAPLRTGIVDGRKVVFELKTDVTQKPAIPRKDRVQRRHVIMNADRSSWEIQARFYLMHFTVARLTVVFFAAFVALNAVFAGFFYATDGRCCGDPDLRFRQVFDFTIQTSTTIGYGGYTPQGTVPNFLVVVLSYISTLINTLFAGLLFTKFVTPVINIQFSDVMTLRNVNGVPCLSFRLGNADGHNNPLTDINVRLTYSYQIPYTDHRGEQKFFRQTEELKLLSNRQHGLLEVWTLRHVLDESSPLFGLNFDEHPGNKIYVFTLSVDAVQDLTKSSVNVQTEYALEDILIGHAFQNQVSLDLETRVATSDYSKMSDTTPYPVWYPAKAGAYVTGEDVKTKTFKP